jgi:hypothetical protein
MCEETWGWIVGIIAILAILVVLLYAIYGGIRSTSLTNERKQANCASVTKTEDRILMYETCK